MTRWKKQIIAIFSIVCIGFVLGLGYYMLGTHQKVVEQTIKAPMVASWLTIVLPDDINLYKQRMANFVQIGGVDPLLSQVFVKKYLAVSYTGDIQKASAEAAAQQFTTGGGPEKVLVNYLKVQSWTAYISLNIDENGRAWVSVSIAIIHPVVEKTLLQFTGIQNVIFGYASGDKQIVK